MGSPGEHHVIGTRRYTPSRLETFFISFYTHPVDVTLTPSGLKPSSFYHGKYFDQVNKTSTSHC